MASSRGRGVGSVADAGRAGRKGNSSTGNSRASTGCTAAATAVKKWMWKKDLCELLKRMGGLEKVLWCELYEGG